MTTQQPLTQTSQDSGKGLKLSLDWWAVISALVLSVAVLLGLQVTW